MCSFCRLPLAGLSVRWASGFFPVDDPDVFVEDEAPGSPQGEAHLDCFVGQMSDKSGIL